MEHDQKTKIKHKISKYKPAVLILVVKKKVQVIRNIIDSKNLNLVIVKV